MVDISFDKITGIESRPENPPKRSLHQWEFPVNTSKFSALIQKSLT